MIKHEANQVVIEAPEDVFGSNPDNSAEVLSDLDTTGSPNNGSGSLNGCHVTIALGSLFCDSDDFSSEPLSNTPSHPLKTTKRTKLPYVMRQSRFGRRRGREPSVLTKMTGRINLAKYTSLNASVDPNITPAYDLLLNPKPPACSNTKGLETMKVLLDTGALILLMPSWQATKSEPEVKPWTNIMVCGTDGRPLAIEGVTKLYARDSKAAFWKKVKFIVTRKGN